MRPYIQRIQVEEGLLDGLDVDFDQGLNALVGPRGSGKSSVIELIRFCLGITSGSTKIQRRAEEHALAVLGSGRVTVTIAINGDRIAYSRTGDDAAPKNMSRATFPLPTVFSQGEIEEVALDKVGRLRLIDAAVSDIHAVRLKERAAVALVASLTKEYDAVASELAKLKEEVARLPAVTIELEQAANREEELTKAAQEAVPEKVLLDSVTTDASMRGTWIDVLQRATQRMTRWQEILLSVRREDLQLDPWPATAGDTDLLQEARDELATTREALMRASESIDRSLSAARKAAAKATADLEHLSDEGRRLRRRLEEIQVGLGAAARATADLRSLRQRLQSIDEIVATRRATLAEVDKRRAKALDELDSLREQRYQLRAAKVGALNQAFRPAVQIELKHLGDLAIYEEKLSRALRKSGLHYQDLATRIAAAMSPRELVEAIERQDIQTIAAAASVGSDRIARLVGHLADQDLADLLTVDVEDFVEFLLLDGTEYKTSTQLSTGQRCTTVIPMLLTGEGVIIVDQPEDNLDNAFVVGTVVKAILEAKGSTQFILATHNANIPVLANAARVVILNSDGRRVFCRQSDKVEAPAIVRYITGLMEGGLEAFRTRGRFYSDHWSNGD